MAPPRKGADGPIWVIELHGIKQFSNFGLAQLVVVLKCVIKVMLNATVIVENDERDRFETLF